MISEAARLACRDGLVPDLATGARLGEQAEDPSDGLPHLRVELALGRELGGSARLLLLALLFLLLLPLPLALLRLLHAQLLLLGLLMHAHALVARRADALAELVAHRRDEHVLAGVDVASRFESETVERRHDRAVRVLGVEIGPDTEVFGEILI